MKTVLGYIPKLPHGYWDTPSYYTVLSDDGRQSYAVLIKTDTKDWYWMYPILGSVKTDAQKEIAEVSDADLESIYQAKLVPCGTSIDAKFVQVQRSIALKQSGSIGDPVKIEAGADVEAGANVIEADTVAKS